MSKKRQRRIAETNAEFEEVLQEEAEKTRFEIADDAALFTVDTRGSKRLRLKVEKKIIPQRNGTYLTSSEKAIVRKLKKSLAEGQGRKKYGEDIVQKVNDKITFPLKDVWADEEDSKIPIVRRSTRQHKIKMPLPGQSYHPTQEAHQDALAEALATEMKKIEKEKESKHMGLLEDTKSITKLLLGEGVEQEEEEEGEAEEGGAHTSNPPIRKKMKEKLTKAQRNKQRLRKELEQEQFVKRTEEQLLKSIDKVDQIVKEIEHEKANKLSKSQLRKLRKTPVVETIDVNGVALSEEMSGSLRAVKPIGVAIKDAAKSLVSAGDANVRSKGGRKKEHPHRAKKIKWVAKYKY